MEGMSFFPPSNPACLPAMSSSATVPVPAYASIAETVASLFTPTIASTVVAAVSQGISQLRKELGVQLQHIQETEHRISSIEEEVQQVFTTVSSHDDAPQALQGKLEDQENTSRCNNLCLLGMSESFNPASLATLCTYTIPTALEIQTHCMVEWSHRIGPPVEKDHHLDQSLSATLIMQTNNLLYSDTGNNAFLWLKVRMSCFSWITLQKSHTNIRPFPKSALPCLK